ncbi:MAG: hypothetical protein Unbinned6284contig1001_58 [Prokaryotic dsDNA virus sp.]|nr:MAG: hypothetical protein Unbinned6284contig1001_58 [Prokaryotic dsDNA virus sp.]|tara:strand:+ start:1166 stop:1339 length:174 start_codon:yes stop_codon:yes gene_type:complete
MSNQKAKPKIVSIQGMPSDHCWQGKVLALADDGKVYISEHDELGSRWVLYVEDNFKG